MKESFVKLHKKMLDWEWYSDSNTKSLFLHLLIIANYKDKSWKGITIKRGQCVVGRKQLSKTLGMSERQIRTCFDHLKSTNELTTKSTNKYTLITIEKYNDYQSNIGITDQQNDQQVDHPPTTPKEYKNNKNNIYTFLEPTIEEVQAYCRERNNRVDAEMFVNFYSAKGWMIGRNKMKNWKSAVHTWERSSKDNTRTKTIDDAFRGM